MCGSIAMESACWIPDRAAAARGELEEAAIGGVDMEPEPLVGNDPGQGVKGVDGAGVCRPGGADDEERVTPGGAVLHDGRLERLRVHPQVGVYADRPDLVLSESGDPGRLLHRVVGVPGDVDDTVGELVPEPGGPGGDQTGQVGHRAARQDETRGRWAHVEEGGHPPHHPVLDGAHARRRTRDPGVAIQAGGEELGQRRGVEAGIGDIGEMPAGRVEHAGAPGLPRPRSTTPPAAAPVGRRGHQTRCQVVIQLDSGGGHRVGSVEPILEEAEDALGHLGPFLVPRLEDSRHRGQGSPGGIPSPTPDRPIYDPAIYSLQTI